MLLKTNLTHEDKVRLIKAILEIFILALCKEYRPLLRDFRPLHDRYQTAGQPYRKCTAPQSAVWLLLRWRIRRPPSIHSGRARRSTRGEARVPGAAPWPSPGGRERCGERERVFVCLYKFVCDSALPLSRERRCHFWKFYGHVCMKKRWGVGEFLQPLISEVRLG